MKQKITEIQIIPIKPTNGLVAFASLVLNDEMYLGSIGIHAKIDGSDHRLTYPTKSVGTKQLNIYHPITKEVSRVIEDAVINKYKDVMKKSSNDRHSGFNNASQ